MLTKVRVLLYHQREAFNLTLLNQSVFLTGFRKVFKISALDCKVDNNKPLGYFRHKSKISNIYYVIKVVFARHHRSYYFLHVNGKKKIP